MFSGGLTGWHFLILLAIVLLLFGATRLPALARSLGQSMNAFKSEMKKGDENTPSTTEGDASTDTTPKP